MADLRTIERDSIRRFVQSAADDGYLSGRVLDYGAGRSPFRDVVEAAGGKYHAYDRKTLRGSVGVTIGDISLLKKRWPAILCNQVIQYQPASLIYEFCCQLREMTEYDGVVVMTGPTNWPIVETLDTTRLTPSGAAELLSEAGFDPVGVQSRAAVKHNGEEWLLGWGAIAHA